MSATNTLTPRRALRLLGALAALALAALAGPYAGIESPTAGEFAEMAQGAAPGYLAAR